MSSELYFERDLRNSVSSSEFVNLTTSFTMEAEDVQNLVQEKVNSSLKTHKEEMLQEIGTLFEKISGSSNISQLNRISSIVTAGEKFKRKSNEQFKYNSKVDLKLEEAANSIDTDKLDEARQHVAEGKYVIIMIMILIIINIFCYLSGARLCSYNRSMYDCTCVKIVFLCRKNGIC